MQQVAFNTHISGKFNTELENLRNSVLTMGGTVEQQLIDTIKSIRNNMPGLAEKVMLNDAAINSMEMQIDQECLRIIAKRHPTASDLRLVMTISKTITDIERMGDEIVRISRLVTKQQLPSSETVKSSMLLICEQVAQMMRGTFDAFARQDEQSALEVYEQDDLIDNEYNKLLSYIVGEIEKNTDSMRDWLEILWALRSIERVGDRCKNICEYVVGLARGEDARHSTLENMVKKLKNFS